MRFIWGNNLVSLLKKECFSIHRQVSQAHFRGRLLLIISLLLSNLLTVLEETTNRDRSHWKKHWPQQILTSVTKDMWPRDGTGRAAKMSKDCTARHNQSPLDSVLSQTKDMLIWLQKATCCIGLRLILPKLHVVLSRILTRCPRMLLVLLLAFSESCFKVYLLFRIWYLKPTNNTLLVIC